MDQVIELIKKMNEAALEIKQLHAIYTEANRKLQEELKEIEARRAAFNAANAALKAREDAVNRDELVLLAGKDLSVMRAQLEGELANVENIKKQAQQDAQNRIAEIEQTRIQAQDLMASAKNLQAVVEKEKAEFKQKLIDSIKG